MEDLFAFLTRLRAEYNRVYARSGSQARVANSPDPERRCFALAQDGNEHILRVQGPLDSWWGGANVPELIAELDKAQPMSLRVLIESPGGLVSDGLALYSDLRARAREGMGLSTEARGIVASAAVLPFLAAPPEARSMGDGSMIMVHNVWTALFLVGDSGEIRSEAEKAANAAEKMSDTYASILVDRTGMASDTARAAMNAETWYSAADAVEAGYAARVVEDVAEDDIEARKKMKAAIQSYCERRIFSQTAR